MTKQTEDDINNIKCVMKELSEHTKVLIDRMDKRQETHYFMICDLADKMKALEKILGLTYTTNNPKVYKYKRNEKS